MTREDLVFTPGRIALAQISYVPRAFGPQSRWLPELVLLDTKQVVSSRDDVGRCISCLSPTFLREKTRPERQSICGDSVDAQSAKLKQLMEWLVQHGVALVVFPEYCVWPQNLHILRDFAVRGLSSFSGIGHVRPSQVDPRDVESLIGVGIKREQAMASQSKNAAVFFGPGSQVELVTKKGVTDRENCEAGDGPIVINWQPSKNEVMRKLRLSICLDYISAPAGNHDIDIVCALSTGEDEFKRRNVQPCFWANHADFGGSTGYVPSINAGVYSVPEEDHAKPLPAGCEGIMVFDYDGPLNQPRMMVYPHNSLVFRAAITYESHPSDLDGLAATVKEMAGWTSEKLALDRVKSGMNDIHSYVSKSTTNEIMKEMMDAFRGQDYQVRTGTPNELRLLTTHVVLKSLVPPIVEQHRAAHRLYLYVDSLGNRNPALNPPGQGALKDLCKEVVDDRRSRMSSEDVRLARLGENSDSRIVQTDSGDVVVMHFRLGEFDGNDAAHSLVDQYHCLRRLARLNPESVRLTYRIHTERSPLEGLVPYFDAYLICRGDDESLAATQLLADQFNLAFRKGYSVSREEKALPPSLGESKSTYVVKSGVRIRDDWASVIDFLRVVDEPTTLSFTLRPSGRPGAAISSDALQRTIESSEPDKLGSQILSQCSTEVVEDELGLTLTVEFGVGSDSQDIADLEDVIVPRICGSSAIDSDGNTAESLTPAEALRIAHPPYGQMEERGLTRRLRTLPIPLPSMPSATSGIVLGQARALTAGADSVVDIQLSDEVRRRHTYVVGRTGSGKTNLLKNLAAQDLEADGRGMLVIDPHGDLVDFLLTKLDKRKSETMLLDFSDPEFIPVLNPLDIDLDIHPTTDPKDLRAQQVLRIDDFIHLIVRQSYHEFTGPRFEQIMRLALSTMLTQGYSSQLTPSVVEIIELLTSEPRRRWFSKLVPEDDGLYGQWENTFAMRQHDIEEVINWALSKVNEISSDGILKQVFGGGKSSVSIKQLVENDGILLVVIPEWAMSKSASSLLGAFILQRVRKTVYARAQRSGFSVKPKLFSMYVDEFQNFANTEFDEMVAEARKFGLGLCLANQNLQQLESFSRWTGISSRALREALLNNVQTLVTFGSSPNDEEYLGKAMSIEQEDFERIAPFEAIAKVAFPHGARTFSLSTKLAEPDTRNWRNSIVKDHISSGWLRSKQEVDRIIHERALRITELAEKRVRSQAGQEGVRRLMNKTEGRKAVDDWIQGYKALQKQQNGISHGKEVDDWIASGPSGADASEKQQNDTAADGANGVSPPWLSFELEE